MEDKVDELVEWGTHLSHCNQGEYLGSCKYLEDDICPALKKQGKVDELVEWVAEIIYTNKKKHLIRLPEAPPLPTWKQLKSGGGPLGDYDLRLVERYCGVAKQILSHPGLALIRGEKMFEAGAYSVYAVIPLAIELAKKDKE